MLQTVLVCHASHFMSIFQKSDHSESAQPFRKVGWVSVIHLVSGDFLQFISGEQTFLEAEADVPHFQP